MNSNKDYCILNPEEYTKTSEIIINSYDDIDIPISSKCGLSKTKPQKKSKCSNSKDDNSKINQFDKASSTKKLKNYQTVDFKNTHRVWKEDIPDITKINNFDMALTSKRPNQLFQEVNKSQSILNCGKDNLSKTCPAELCHLDIDKDFRFPVDRVVKNIGDKKVFANYRAPSQICYKYREDENNKKLQKMNLKDDHYFKNVTVENDLLNLQYPHGCQIQRVIDTSKFSKDNKGYQNVQKFNYKLANTTSIKDRYPTSNCAPIDPMDYCPARLQTSTTNLEHPIVNYQMNEVSDSSLCKQFLPIGPVRNDRPHCESDWDNVTQRKSIRRPQKQYPQY